MTATATARLRALRGRPALVAIAAMNLITGIVGFAVLAPLSFGMDAATYRNGAEALWAGGYDRLFVYSPPAALLATPLTWLPLGLAALTMTVIGLAVLAVGLAVETKGAPRLDRALICVATLGFLPLVNELLLGQVTLLFAAALWPVVRRPDRPLNGVLLGAAMALAPKPMFAPVLLWMLIRRRRALVGAVVSAAVVLLAGILVLGPDTYARWLAVLKDIGPAARQGNLSLWAGGMTGGAVLAAVPLLAAFAVSLFSSDDAGLVASLLAGLIFAPYTLLYSATILLLAVPNALRLMPTQTRLLALAANLILIPAATVWLAVALLATGAAAVASRRARPGAWRAAGPGPRWPQVRVTRRSGDP